MVYIIETDFYFKIGVTSNFNKRIKAYNTHNPDFSLVLSIEGGVDIEKELHIKYNKYRLKGNEWFAKFEGYIQTIILHCEKNNLIYTKLQIEEELSSEIILDNDVVSSSVVDKYFKNEKVCKNKLNNLYRKGKVFTIKKRDIGVFYVLSPFM